MTNTKLEQLTKEIQSAVPSIMKLEFGCKFRLVNEHWKKKDNYICIVVGKNNWAGLGNEECTNDIDTLEYGKFEGFGDYVDEIIGRDITPIDILKTRKDLSIDGCGGIFIRNFCLNTSLNCNKKGDLWEMEYCGHYDIGKPLQDQSDETISFLHELICKDG